MSIVSFTVSVHLLHTEDVTRGYGIFVIFVKEIKMVRSSIGTAPTTLTLRCPSISTAGWKYPISCLADQQVGQYLT